MGESSSKRLVAGATEQMDQKHDQGLLNRELLEKRPGIFIVGSPNVGKRTLLSRKSAFSTLYIDVRCSTVVVFHGLGKLKLQ